MKRRIPAVCGLGLALALAALTPLLGGCDQTARSATIADDLATNQTPAPEADAAANATNQMSATGQELANAPGAVISTPSAASAVPSNNPQFNDMVKLAQAGVGETILMAYVTNSAGAFNVSPDDVVYLNDLGVPQTVVNAMLQRDQYFTSVAAQPPAPPVYANPPSPQPDYANTAPIPQAPPPDQYAPPPVANAAPPMADAAPPMTEPAAAQMDMTAPPLTNSPGVIDDADNAPNGAYSYFYDSLAPYGNWVDIDGYGPCWQPTAVATDPNWQPYCDGGDWVYTDSGWCWNSGYSWGWAPFHYGRWFHHSRWGWCWAPDTVWGPAWVSWRYNGSYCGWAPLPPTAVYRPGFGFTFYGDPVGAGFTFGLEPDSFVFVSLNHLNGRQLSRARLNHREVARIYATTRLNNQLIRGPNNQLINRGVPVTLVAAASHYQIPAVHIRTDVEAPGPAQFGRDGRSLALYRPYLPMARLTAKPMMAGEGVPRDVNFDLRSRIVESQQRAAFAPTDVSASDQRPIISNPASLAPHDDLRAGIPANNNFAPQTSPGRADNSTPNQWADYWRGQAGRTQSSVPADNNRRLYLPQDDPPRYTAPQWGRAWPSYRQEQSREDQPRQETAPHNSEAPRSAAPAQSAPSHESSSQSTGNSSNNGGSGGRGH